MVTILRTASQMFLDQGGPISLLPSSSLARDSRPVGGGRESEKPKLLGKVSQYS